MLRTLGAALLLVACGGESLPPTPSHASELCPAPNRMVGDRCLEPGVQDDGCAAGTLALDDGSCQPAGIPADRCAEGFVSDDRGGCIAVLPAELCPPGSMAIPGDRACRPIMPCGTGRWGELPVDDASVYVDGSYALGDSDGSAAKPWPTIGDAITSAAPGALIAVAEGSYVEDVYIYGKNVRLWGVCPEKVSVVATGNQLAAIMATNADGSEVGGIAVTGPALGITVSGLTDFVVDRVWVHDMGWRGIHGEDTLGATSIVVRDALVERALEYGVSAVDADVTLERTHVRETRATSEGMSGHGATILELGGIPPTLIVRRSHLEQNHDAGMYMQGGTATVEGSVVRATRPRVVDQDRGIGIMALVSAMGFTAALSVQGSVIENNRTGGLHVSGSSAGVETSVIRGTLPQASSSLLGRGIMAHVDPTVRTSFSVVVRQSVVEQNRDGGILVGGGETTVEGTIVRETLPSERDEDYGRGVEALASPVDLAPGVLSMRGSVLEANHDVGLRVGGCSALVEGSIVRGTLPRAADQESGRGISAQLEVETGVPAALTLRTSLLEANHDVSVYVGGANATIEDTFVRNTLPRAVDGIRGDGIGAIDLEADGRHALVLRRLAIEHSGEIGVLIQGLDATVEDCVISDSLPSPTGDFGDGLVVSQGYSGPSQVQIAGTRIRQSARAAVTLFGSFVTVTDTELECQAIDLAVEPWNDVQSTIDNRGDVFCGCPQADQACKAVGVGLAPPSPLDE